MPICYPEHPPFESAAEHQVWEMLRHQLRAKDVLMANVPVTDHKRDYEADIVVLMPDAGVVVVEVKGGSVWREKGYWRTKRDGKPVTIDPVRQAKKVKYALRDYVELDPRWQREGRQVRWAHAVAVPNTDLGDDFSCTDCPRWMIADRNNLSKLATLLREIPQQQENKNEPLSCHNASLLLDILSGRGLPQRDLLSEASQREFTAQRLTEEQASILGATKLITRVEVRGGAGSGKTWLAMEQARRLSRSGQRVAMLCYSRGLAAYLNRFMAEVPKSDRPAYVGEFHRLGTQWGAEPGSDTDSAYWEHRLPEQMRELALALPAADKFDAVIIDEAQDFADAWWPAVLASLREPETGGVYIFSDEGQRVFARFGKPPIELTPLVLETNLRNTRQIAGTFISLATTKMRLSGGDGPAVRFIECPSTQALATGEDVVDDLCDAWGPENVALLTTGSRHPEQVQRQKVGQDEYWASFWDAEQVFYGTVLGFKGLERRAVVLVLNELTIGDRSKERLYVGLSRARDQLVVCGSSTVIRQLGGDDVLRRIRGN